MAKSPRCIAPMLRACPSWLRALCIRSYRRHPFRRTLAAAFTAVIQTTSQSLLRSATGCDHLKSACARVFRSMVHLA